MFELARHRRADALLEPGAERERKQRELRACRVGLCAERGVVDQRDVAITGHDSLQRGALKCAQCEVRFQAVFALVAEGDARTPTRDVEPIRHQVVDQAAAGERQRPR